MERVLGSLELNGSFYTVLLDVLSENAANRRDAAVSPFLTEIINVDGSEQKVCSWLKRITCVAVTCEFKSNLPIEAYSVRKICDDVAVPALVTIHFKAGTPPGRRFQLQSQSPLPSGRTGALR
jgi:hypothetical protein